MPMPPRASSARNSYRPAETGTLLSANFVGRWAVVRSGSTSRAVAANVGSIIAPCEPVESYEKAVGLIVAAPRRPFKQREVSGVSRPPYFLVLLLPVLSLLSFLILILLLLLISHCRVPRHLRDGM